MTFEQFYTGIRTRWLLILVMVLLTVATTVGQSLTHGKIYVSHALVLVDMHAVNPMTYRQNPMLGTEPQQQLFFVNKIYLALNEEVARRMASMDPTINSPEFVEYWEKETEGKGDIISWYAKILSDSILINIPKNTTIIDFGAYGQSPERAAALANAYAKSYIDVANSIKHTQARVDALQVHSKKIKQELDAAWKEFLKARTEGEITSLGELYSHQNTQTMQTNVRISEKIAEQITAKNRISEFSKNAANTPNASSLNFAINSLSTDLAREKVQLQQYKAMLGPQHPSIKEGEARLAEIQRMLDTEAARVQQQEVQSAEIYKGSTEQLYTQLEIEKSRTAKETEARNKLMGIIQKISSLTLNYSEAYQTEQNSITTGLVAFTNLTLLSQATAPTRSSLPNWSFILMFSAIVGLAIGIGTATLLERLDGRLHSPRAIQEKTKIPNLGILKSQISA
jgi:succinoglycan biosynthesis transport protein ExoP